MERKLKILKAVLLLRRVNRHQTKERQLADAEKYYTDEQTDEWIEMLKHPEQQEPYPQDACHYEEEENYTPSCTAHDYSPSNPWDAPGMSVSDFLPGCR